MRKITAALLFVALVLTVTCLTHGIFTGIGVPYQDTTKAQAAYERYHWGITSTLFLMAGTSWVLALGAAAISNFVKS
jgi:hypothetical protein